MNEKNSRPTVSVITIFLNENRFLRESVESVIAQTFGDWELLLVDDGSTDGSTAIAKQLAQHESGRIRYLAHTDHQNLGMSASRNLGIAESQGAYIAFLDGDDIFFRDRLFRHVDVLETFPQVDAVQSDLIHWHSWQREDAILEDDYVRVSVCGADRIMPPPLGLISTIAIPEFYPGICSITVRREVTIELGGFEPRFRTLYEDQIFMTKLYSQKLVYVIQDYLAAYRIHDASTVESLRPSAHREKSLWKKEYQAFLAWQREYLRDFPEVTEVLQKFGVLDNRASVFDRKSTAIRAKTRHLLEKVLPSVVYRAAMRRRRQRAGRRSLRRYESLCRQMVVVSSMPDQPEKLLDIADHF
jgi:glycosyltransferase involved in cell wall biosynthesis